MCTKRETLDEANARVGCLGKSAEDEPVFVLCARDPLGGTIVRQWAAAAIVQRVTPDKIADALRIASAMDAWLARDGEQAKG